MDNKLFTNSLKTRLAELRKKEKETGNLESAEKTEMRELIELEKGDEQSK